MQLMVPVLPRVHGSPEALNSRVRVGLSPVQDVEVKWPPPRPGSRHDLIDKFLTATEDGKLLAPEGKTKMQIANDKIMREIVDVLENKKGEGKGLFAPESPKHTKPAAKPGFLKTAEDLIEERTKQKLPTIPALAVAVVRQLEAFLRP